VHHIVNLMKSHSILLSIRNRVYDVTDFAALHPGGSKILTGAGIDATALYESYHSHPVSREKADRSLKLLHQVSEKMNSPFQVQPEPKQWSGPCAGSQQAIEGADAVMSAAFFNDVRNRVFMFLGANRGKNSQMMLFEISVTLLLSALSYVTMYTSEGFVRFFSMFLFASLKTRLGFAMHHGNHAAVSSKAWVNRIVGYVLDLIGASSDIWRVQHDVAPQLS
jgi:acyl-lipid (8-3)-desaturase